MQQAEAKNAVQKVQKSAKANKFWGGTNNTHAPPSGASQDRGAQARLSAPTHRPRGGGWASLDHALYSPQIPAHSSTFTK